MKIGTQLKKIRILLGLTQKEFSAGIVTESFYSRVESNHSNISMTQLIEILNHNHVSLYDFFESLTKEHFEHEVIVAFIDQDIPKLKNYLNITKSHQIVIKLMIAILENQNFKISEQCYQKLRTYALKAEDNQKIVLVQCLLVHLCELDELSILMDKLAQFPNSESDDLTLRLKIQALLVCMRRFYENGDDSKAIEAIKLIDSLPQKSITALERVVAQYYLALIKKDLSKAKQIKKLLTDMGYIKYHK